MGKEGYYVVVSFILIVLQLSCDGFTKDIKVDYSNHKAKGVIVSLLSNTDIRDSAFRRSYYYSSSESDTHSNRIYITNSVAPGFRDLFYEAHVSLISEEEELPLTFIERNDQQNIYRPFFAAPDEILPGKVYQINAAFDPSAVDQYVQDWTPVSATDTMPDVVSFTVENIQFKYSDGNLAGTPEGGYFDLQIEDDPDRTNAYLVDVSAILYQDTTYDHLPKLVYGNIERPDKTTDLDIFETSRNDLFHEDDFTKEGRKRIHFRFRQNYGSYDREKPTSLLIRISNLSDHYIRFQRSSQQYSINKENPFAEPAEIYTNVENGYGIFALSSRSYAEVEVK